MNITATKKFALATVTAPVLAALAIGLAGGAHADSSAPSTAADQISSLQAEGIQVVVTKDKIASLDQCSVISVRQDHPREHHGGAQRDAFHTAYVNLSCH